jgi:hypothetical protein
MSYREAQPRSSQPLGHLVIAGISLFELNVRFAKGTSSVIAGVWFGEEVFR